MRYYSFFAAITLCAACSGSDDKPAAKSSSQSPSPGDVDDGCARGSVESNLSLSPLSGPKVSDGALMAPGAEGYVVSSTFLRLRPGDAVNKRFLELSGAIIAGLSGRPGMQAFQVGLSASCTTARTLAVWADTEAMYDFVGSDEHMAAVNAVSEVSRGGSIVVHWDAATVQETSWDEATRRLNHATGPFY